MSGSRAHQYAVTLQWTGNLGTGTSNYRAYSRAHTIEAPGKPPIDMSSDPAFRGDRARWNPEELLVDALASCHMLWYLHLAADAGIVVTAYEDSASGTMVEDADGGGRFSEVTLRPVVTIAAGHDSGRATALHHDAHRLCFIANSVNFPVACEPGVQVQAGGAAEG